ncbi:hypothetical protein HPHPH30_0406 [Helicobacter pylori Hp H-30]|uniref:Uncharacterized protein n=1 Tax=Helicobacter pylori Hp P-2 TaxID=992073 RepID=J0PMA6_HELPX|nr:hypothetical protein HPHPH30_0406 [Helicobacter pylori Hp H-30]EJB99700.1 hypothetical protein HPHPP2_0409 [Helicobacter pylori Hp P-2]EJC57632.1 hypothetical protein HPHPP2B_0413 [Helicobacter pylori Hp P-2b]
MNNKNKTNLFISRLYFNGLKIAFYGNAFNNRNFTPLYYACVFVHLMKHPL